MIDGACRVSSSRRIQREERRTDKDEMRLQKRSRQQPQRQKRWNRRVLVSSSSSEADQEVEEAEVVEAEVEEHEEEEEEDNIFTQESVDPSGNLADFVVPDDHVEYEYDRPADWSTSEYELSVAFHSHSHTA